MTYFLPVDTWWRLLLWTVLGFSIYGIYGYRHSRLRGEQSTAKFPVAGPGTADS
jgi:APA family basic amino acid/polyamine antiporter